MEEDTRGVAMTTSTGRIQWSGRATYNKVERITGKLPGSDIEVWVEWNHRSKAKVWRARLASTESVKIDGSWCTVSVSQDVIGPDALERNSRPLVWDNLGSAKLSLQCRFDAGMLAFSMQQGSFYDSYSMNPLCIEEFNDGSEEENGNDNEA
jgi:hypothetical protein